ncbi:hypothetical protein ACJMK2_043710 [Sinanodonta woodiana]|uniref:C2 domain-containing protein n=1 Tax=Sinanodonta woodiana TaxID=1069815 RepID=A0ABD3VXT2_SINWO
MSEPLEIALLVHGAKGLKGRKAGRCKFSVIFGLGSKKFRTNVVKDPDGNPAWNEETRVPVIDILDQVFFIVMEKDDVLGQIRIPVTSLHGVKGQIVKATLQPNKKCPKPQGEIIYQCYVSKYRTEGEVHVPIIKAPSTDNSHHPSAFARLRQKMASPNVQRKLKKDDKQSGRSNFNKKLSRSIQDLFSFGKMSTTDPIDIDEKENKVNEQKSKRKFSLNFLSFGSGLDKVGQGPVLLNVNPNRGLVEGGDRLCIEGQNLGIDKKDIIELSICGCNCIDTLEYESPSRIYCTTLLWKAGTGNVVIETSSGISTLKNAFSFYYPELEESKVFVKQTISVDPKLDNVEAELDLDHGGEIIKSGSNTMPRMKGVLKDQVSSDLTPSFPARYKKRHSRHSSESVLQAFQTNGPPQKSPPKPLKSAEQLQEEVEKLKEENEALKKDNQNMKEYIDKLVSKCLEHCPEALMADETEKTRLFVL